MTKKGHQHCGRKNSHHLLAAVEQKKMMTLKKGHQIFLVKQRSGPPENFPVLAVDVCSIKLFLK